MASASKSIDPKVTAWKNAHAAIRAVVDERMPDISERRRDQLSGQIVASSIEAGFDPLFVLAFIEVESKFDHEAVSPMGARGLMQVLPSTWDQVARENGWGRLERFDPVNNVRVGVKYLSDLSRNFKRMRSLALAYNAGPGGATRIITGASEPSDEARTYPTKIAAAYGSLLREHGHDPRLAEKKFRDPAGSILQP
jgi:soluble lytic murein transglycosylase-like protein